MKNLLMVLMLVWLPLQNARAQHNVTVRGTVVNAADNTVRFSLARNPFDRPEAMQKHEVTGVNLWAEKAWKDPVAQAYGIQGIPKYFLIDHNGNFKDANPPRASINEGKDLIKALEEALAAVK